MCAAGTTFVADELTSQKLKPLPPPKGKHNYHVYCSAHNRGATALMRELAEARGAFQVCIAKQVPAVRHTPGAAKRPHPRGSRTLEKLMCAAHSVLRSAMSEMSLRAYHARDNGI